MRLGYSRRVADEVARVILDGLGESPKDRDELPVPENPGLRESEIRSSRRINGADGDPPVAERKAQAVDEHVMTATLRAVLERNPALLRRAVGANPHRARVADAEAAATHPSAPIGNRIVVRMTAEIEAEHPAVENPAAVAKRRGPKEGNPVAGVEHHIGRLHRR